jgi:hypothetical protein
VTEQRNNPFFTDIFTDIRPQSAFPPFKTPWKYKVLKMAPEEGLEHLSPRLQFKYS